MHEALVARVRYHIQKANFMGLKEAESTLLLAEAADAIEELIAEANDAIEELSKQLDDMNEANIALYGALPKWIPVTEALPPVDEEVLVVAYGSMMRIWNMHRLDPELADVCWECEDGTLDDMCVVTHWMPLPEPPKEEEA